MSQTPQPRRRHASAGRVTRIVLTGLLLMAAAGGCIRKFNRANYETIGMHTDEHTVRSRLGRPDAEKGNVWIYERSKPYYQAIIYFRNGQVVRKEWYPSRDLAPGAEEIEVESADTFDEPFIKVPSEGTTPSEADLPPDAPDDPLAPTPLPELP